MTRRMPGVEDVRVKAAPAAPVSRWFLGLRISAAGVASLGGSFRPGTIPWPLAVAILGTVLFLGANLFGATAASERTAAPLTADGVPAPRAQVLVPCVAGGSGGGGSGGGPSGSLGAFTGDTAVARGIERLLRAPEAETVSYVALHTSVDRAGYEDEPVKFVAALRRLANSPRPTTRRAALACFGRLPSSEEDDAVLTDALRDDQPTVRREAVIAITRRCLDRRWGNLLPLVNDPDQAVRMAIAEGLAKVDQRMARDAVRGLLVDPSDVVACAAARAVGRQPGAALSPEVVVAACSGDPRVRLAAARALAEAHSPDGLRALLELVDAAEAETRIEAIRGLERTGGAPASAALERVACTGARAREERVMALDALTTLKEPAAPDAVLRVATDDADPVVRLAASRTLLARNDPHAVKLLADLRRLRPGRGGNAADLELVRRVASDSLREAARAGIASAVALVGSDLDLAMESLGTPPASDQVTALVRMVEYKDEATALRVVALLSGRGGAASAMGLARLARHLEPPVREAAFLAMAHLRLRFEDAAAAVRAARDDDDPSVRAAAFTALGAIGDASDVPSILEALSCPEKDVAAAAYEAIRSISGARLPYRPECWRQWWEETRTKAAPAAGRSLTQIESGGSPEALDLARTTIERNCWSDVQAVQARLEAWLDSTDPRMRLEAYGLIAKCRLATLADRVTFSLRFVTEPAELEAGRDCAAALGVRID